MDDLRTVYLLHIYNLGTFCKPCYKPNIANLKAAMGDMKRIREVHSDFLRTVPRQTVDWAGEMIVNVQ
jgi:hypothetical protein